MELIKTENNKADDEKRRRYHCLKSKKYDQEHPEKFALRNKRYKDRNREKINQKSKQYNIDNPLKYEAHKIMQNEIKRGRLVKKPCAKCGSLKVHGHHEDYNKPLDVVWLCPRHHKERHIELLKQKPPNS